MAKYVDGFVLSIPKKKLDEYRRMAREAGKTWRKYGALDYKETIMDDAGPEGVTFTFPKMAKTKDGEVTVLAFIVFKSRADRNRINKKVMADPLMKKYEEKPMPFDMKRFAYGGFEAIVDA